MSVDAGTIWASIRLRLDKLEADTGKAVKSLNGMALAVQNSGKSVEALNKLGAKLSLTVTAPLVAAGAAAIKFASDQGEALNAANVVFKESSKIITDWGENAAKQAGLSKAEFYQSAAVTGSLLKGMGLSLNEAAEQTIDLTKRAADMASIFNTDVNDATMAVSAALRGEMEPIRRYGVTLSEAAVQAKALSLGLANGRGEISNYAKAQARIALIMEQTNDIAGDFVNTSDQQANSTRILLAETKNQAAALGQQLLPYALQIIQSARKMVEGFGNLTDEQKKNIIQIAALAAGMGPLAMGISKAAQAVNVLKVAMTALAANPVLLAIAGVAALTAGVVALGDAAHDRYIEGLAEEFGDIAENAKVSGEQLEWIVGTFSKLKGASADQIEKSMAGMAKSLGLSYDQINAIVQADERLNSEMKLTVDMITENAMGSRRISEYNKAAADAKAKEAASAKEITDAQGQDQITKRKNAEKEYKESVAETNLLVQRGIIDTEEGREREMKATQAYRDELIKLGYAQEKEKGTLGSNALQAAVNRLDELGAATVDTAGKYDELIQKVSDLDTETAKSSSEQRASMLAEIEATDLAVDKKQELIDKVNKYYDLLADNEAQERFKQNTEAMFSATAGFLSALSSLVTNVYASKSEALDVAMQKELEAAGLAEDTAVETAEKELAIAQESGDEEAILEAQNALKKAQIEEKYAKEKQETEYEGAMLVWNLQRLATIASAAQAIMNAFASGAKVNIIAAAAQAAIAATVGGIQIAAVQAARPVKSFQTGGIVNATAGGELVNVAENGSGEVLFNTGSTGQAFIQQMAGAIAAQLGSGNGQLPATINIIVDSRIFASETVRLINNGEYTILARAIK